MSLTEYEKNILENLKFIKQQPHDRHLEIYLGFSYMNTMGVKFDDKHVTEKDNKNEIIDLVINTIIKHLEEKNERKPL